MNKADITVLQEKGTVDNIVAREMMSTGKVPTKHIRRFPGRGGHTFRYVSHVFLTRALNAAFSHYWSTEMSNPQVYDDGSASVILTLHLDFPGPDGKPLYRRSITEVGAHSVSSGMNKADLLASAASRALYRCCMRAFGIGLEFYEDEDPLDDGDMAIKVLKEQGTRKKLTSAEMKMLMEDKLHVTKENASELFEEAYKAINDFANEKEAQNNVQ